MQTDRVPTASFPFGQIHLRTQSQIRVEHLISVKYHLLKFRHPISKSRQIAIQFIRGHPLKGQTVALNGCVSAIPTQFPVSFWRADRRERHSLALILIFVEPAFRQKQLPFDQAVSFPTSVPQIDPVLAVGNLPHRSTVLRGDPYRVSRLV